MSTFNFLNLSADAFEVQFFNTIELKSKEDGQIKRYQITSMKNEHYVVEAKNPYDLWLQLNEFYPQVDMVYIDHILETFDNKLAVTQINQTYAYITTMSDFVELYMTRFMENGTDFLSVYEITESEDEYFYEEEEEQEEQEEEQEEQEEEQEEEEESDSDDEY
jgi:hypothetical protein